MNSFMYEDGSDADANFVGHQHTKKILSEQEFWNEMFEIQEDLKNQGFHK